MQLTAPMEKAVASCKKPTALSTDTYPATETGGADLNGSCSDAPLAALRQQLAGVGLSVHRMHGDELALTGPHFSRCVPDARCAWLLVRQLRGRA